MKKPMQHPLERLVAIAAALVLAGCASGVKLDEPAPVENRTGAAGSGSGGAGSGQAGQSGVTSVNLGSKNASDGLANLIYFDFDAYVVKDEFRPVVDQHAKLLNADRKKKLTIEGHTDERGGREYNLALGQRRAEAVQKSLSLLGVAAGQTEAVSFGEERPAAQGSDEAAWAKNRRAELIQK